MFPLFKYPLHRVCLHPLLRVGPQPLPRVAALQLPQGRADAQNDTPRAKRQQARGQKQHAWPIRQSPQLTTVPRPKSNAAPPHGIEQDNAIDMIPKGLDFPWHATVTKGPAHSTPHVIPTNYTPVPTFRTQQFITQKALNAITTKVWSETDTSFLPTHLEQEKRYAQNSINIDHFCAPVIRLITGQVITQYKKLQRNPITREMWSTVLGKEFESMVQGDKKTNTPGTDSICVLTHEQIRNIPKDRVVTYAQLVVNFRPQKKDSN